MTWWDACFAVALVVLLILWWALLRSSLEKAADGERELRTGGFVRPGQPFKPPLNRCDPLGILYDRARARWASERPEQPYDWEVECPELVR